VSIFCSLENPLGENFFQDQQEIWPHSHADLQKSCYSAPRIQKSVEEVLSAKFFSIASHIKVLCTCPNKVYKLLLEIT
jgi:hypothetical protein